jgi:hypothetical protein
MSNEDMQRKMEFIIEWQAKFASHMEMMREVQAADAKRLKDAILGVVETVGSLTRAQMSADGRINLLTEAQKLTDESIKRLTNAQARTEASLKILVNVVERHISGNGGSHSHA